MNIHNENKKIINLYKKALYDCDKNQLSAKLDEIFAPEAQVKLAFPFENLDGSNGLFEKAFKPLLKAIPDLERRDYIMIAGADETGNWVGTAGFYIGVFEEPWLDIPPSYHATTMRFCEFFRLVDGKIVEMQALWDIPQVMMQANAWPMTPSLGVENMAPAPATQDGIVTSPYNAEKSAASLKIVTDMLNGLSKHAEGGAEAMGLEKYWHPKCCWYGPAGIGSNRRISGFRNWHQIPFLKAMPDRQGGSHVGKQPAFFGDDNYVGFTAWPGMKMKITGDGWMGIVPGNQEITMRSLDFWRCENGLIRENWVLVDILDVYHQLGVDVFSRMRELTASRQVNKPQL